MTATPTLEQNRLYGTDSHVHLISALEGLDIDLAGQRMTGYPFSIHQILGHMLFWQDIGIARIEGRPYETGDSSSDGWQFPARPASEAAWSAMIADLTTGLAKLEARLETMADDELALRNVRMTEGHNSYHLGQIVMLRRMLGAWPPPKGGDTW